MSTKDLKSLPERINRTLAAIPRSGIRDFFDIVSSMHDVISLSIGEPDFDTPWHVREASIFALERGATSYTSNLGLLKLRKALAQYVGRTFGLEYDPESEILITVGVSEALDLAVRALANPGDEILYHEPCYVSYRPVIQLAHGTPVAVETRPENGFKLTRSLLEQHITPRTKALLLNYPNNPTGATMTRPELEAVAGAAREHDLLVISDEIYAELSYDQEHVSIAALPEMRERTLFLHGFSKSWAMTGFRIGYACGPAPLIDAMMKIHQYTMLCAPIVSQEAAVEALQQAEQDIQEMRAEYRKRRNFLVNSFRELGLPCATPQGAFYAFPGIQAFGLTSKAFALQFLEREKVAVVPGSAFGACGEGHIRCAYSTALADIQEALKRLARFLSTIRR
jgi:aminotransferase